MATLITLIVFMIIGLVVNKFISEVRNEVEAADREKARLEEEERLRILALEERRIDWENEHPGVPFPEDSEKPDEAEDKEPSGDAVSEA